jgi:8-oxo-dGTP pyrophosphatase MutT (NUDIX family)
MCVVLATLQVDAGETPEAALVRELQEELSIQVGQTPRAAHLIGVYCVK